MSEEKQSGHTAISFLIGWLAALTIFIVVFPLLDSSDSFWKDWGNLAFNLALTGLVCQYFMDIFLGYGVHIKPKFNKIEGIHAIRTIIIFVLMMFFQIALNYVPISIRAYEYALAVVFSSVSEEFIFRGLIISFFIFLAKKQEERAEFKVIFSMMIILPDKYQKENHQKKELSYIELMGIIVSAVAFMLFHENYYGDLTAMLLVLSWGFLLGFSFWYWEDITSCIIAHFFINILWAMIYLGETWWMVFL